MNCKGFGRKQYFEVLSLHLSGGTEENHKTLRIAGLWAEI
jgi:hypothetical protein